MKHAAAPASRRRRRLKLTTPALLGLPVSWLVVFLVVPAVIVALYSVNELSLNPGPHSFALGGWYRLFHAGFISLFWKSAKMSLIVSALVVAAAYPLAYFLALSGTRRKYAEALAASRSRKSRVSSVTKIGRATKGSQT